MQKQGLREWDVSLPSPAQRGGRVTRLGYGKCDTCLAHATVQVVDHLDNQSCVECWPWSNIDFQTGRITGRGIKTP